MAECLLQNFALLFVRFVHIYPITTEKFMQVYPVICEKLQVVWGYVILVACHELLASNLSRFYCICHFSSLEVSIQKLQVLCTQTPTIHLEYFVKKYQVISENVPFLSFVVRFLLVGLD